jgi:hypothetical protein
MEITLNLQPQTGELRPQHNGLGRSSTRENVLEYDPDEHTLVNIRTDSVQYGTFDGQPAALVIFRFIFKFRPGFRRIRNFHVNVEFRKQNATTASHPKVLRFAPEERRGRIFAEERSNIGNAGVVLPPGRTGAKVKVDDGIARKINKEYEMKLSGWKKSSDVATDNVLVWDCTESKKAAKGVLPGYRAAAIIQCDSEDPFIATFEMDAERGIFQFDKNVFEYLNVFAKRELDDPVIFDPKKPMGHQYPDLGDFKDLSLDDLVALDGFQEWEVQKECVSQSPQRIDGAVTVEPKPTRGGNTVYRVRGLPCQISETEARDFVEHVCAIFAPDYVAFITSLAKNPHREESVAVVRFNKTPPQFKDISVEEWYLKVPIPNQDRPDGLLFDVHFKGLTPLAEPKGGEADIDVIAVSGLGGHAFGSFKERGGDHMWLRDSLPQDLPTARILTYGHDSHLNQSNSFQKITDLGRQLHVSIKSIRNYNSASGTSPERPLVLIGHSLGGLLTTQALVSMSEGDEADRANFRATCGLMAFGTPNRGMDIRSLIAMVGDQPNRYLVETLRPGSEVLHSLQENFHRVFCFRDSKVFSFFELQESPTAEKVGDIWKMTGPSAILVDKDSAMQGRKWEKEGRLVGLNKDHSSLVKFQRYEEEYEWIKSYLKDVADTASIIVRKRFSVT